MNGVKSKQRVADHGEVFTPPWMVEAMLDLVKGETERIDSRFLEPACGSGNFLVADPAAQARRRRTQVREVRLREAALRAARADVHLRHRAAGGQHRRVPREHAGDPRRLPESRRVGRPLSRRVLRAVAEPRPRRRADDAHQRWPADHLCRVGLPRQGQVPAARLPPRHAHASRRPSARRARSSPTWASTRSSRRPRPTRR